MKTFVYVANSGGGGVAAYRLENDGRMERIGGVLEKQQVSPLVSSRDSRFLYAVVKGERPDLASFAIDSSSGELVFLSMVEIPAAFTYMSVDATGRYLLGASYDKNLVCALPVSPQGFAQSEPAALLRPGRNPHCIVLDWSNRFAYVPLLGNDQIAQYRFDQHNGALVPNSPPVAANPREAGPRHLIVAPDNRNAYLLTEMGGEIISYALDQDAGVLTEMHSVSILPEDKALPPGSYTPPVNATGGGNSPVPVTWAADLRITPDGCYIYASERTNSTVSCFKVDAVSGRLDLLRSMETEAQPRGIAIDQLGRHFFAAGEKSGQVSVYRIEGDTGSLSQLGAYRTGEKPNWIEVVSIF